MAKVTLSRAREHMATQSQQLVSAQQRVDELLSLQQKLRVALNGGGAPSMHRGSTVTSQAPAAYASDAKVAEVRQLLGAAVRSQAEQQLEVDTLRSTLREERTSTENAKVAAARAAEEVKEMREKVQKLQDELNTERTERMEEGAAAMEREEALQEKVDELEAAEKERQRQQKMMEEAEAAMAPPSGPAPSIAVAKPPPPPPAAGFDANMGGFSL